MSDTPELRWHATPAVEKTLEQLRVDVRERLIPADALTSLTRQLRFRDERGTYWAPGIAEPGWFRAEGGQWRAASAAPARLEGPTQLIGWGALPTPAPRLKALASDASAPASSDPVQGLTRLVAARREDYQRGDITSISALMLLTQLHVQDADGTFWRPGVRTGRWYSFAGARWQPAPAPPDPTRLAGPRPARSAAPSAPAGMRTCPSCGGLTAGKKFCTLCGKVLGPEPAAAAAAVSAPDPRIEASAGAFAQQGMGVLPEPLVEAWKPPANDPETLAACPACGFPNAGSSGFCGNCGRALTQPAAPAAPPAQQFCGNCGAAVSPGKKFCTSCGTKVG